MDMQTTAAGDDERLPNVTVKNMRKATWDRARRAAHRNDEPMHEWLGRAIGQLADREESGPREIPPPSRESQLPQAAAPAPLDAEAITRLAAVMMAARQMADAAGMPVPKGAARAAMRLLAIELDRAKPPSIKRKPALLLDHACDAAPKQAAFATAPDAPGA